MITKFVTPLIASAVLALTAGTANASTYSVLGTFNNGAFLTGSIGLNDGLLLSVNLHGDNVMPGDSAVNWVGTPICNQSSCVPSLSSYSYIIPGALVSETYSASTQAYSFYFNGGATLAYLTLDLTLLSVGGGVITAGHVWDPACGSAPYCEIYNVGADLTGGTLTAVTPLPATLPLFATGLAGLGLLGWRRKRKAAA